MEGEATRLSYIMISANIVVKNEADYLDRVLTQVLKLADEVLIADMGSTDGTQDIIESSRPSKKIFYFPDYGEIRDARNRLLKYSLQPWIWIVDGDEVWPDEELYKLRVLLNSHPDKLAFAFSFRQFMPWGEAEHQARTIRLFKKTPTIKWVNEFPNEILADEKGRIASHSGARNTRQDEVLFVPNIRFEHYSGVKKGQWRIEHPKKFKRPK